MGDVDEAVEAVFDPFVVVDGPVAALLGWAIPPCDEHVPLPDDVLIVPSLHVTVPPVDPEAAGAD